MEGLIQLRPGQIFASDYRVIRPLAQGGMGAVYVVEQISTSEQRALKLMHPRLVADARNRQRFDQEARVASRIASAHVVRVIQAGVESDSGTPWICLELLSGLELRAHVAAAGPLSPGHVALLFEQLGHALARAHESRVVHRDLKPENIFLCAPRSPGVAFTAKVLDFGIAKLGQDNETTQAVGTPLWMAPEQAGSGQPISPATDVWAIGLIAFWALTGETFWKSPHLQDATVLMLLAELLSPEHPAASSRAIEIGKDGLLPEGFDTWFAQCVQGDPGKRFAEAGAACEALVRLLPEADGAPISTLLASSTPPPHGPTPDLVALASAPTEQMVATPSGPAATPGASTTAGVVTPRASAAGETPGQVTATPRRRWLLPAVSAGTLVAALAVASWTVHRTREGKADASVACSDTKLSCPDPDHQICALGKNVCTQSTVGVANADVTFDGKATTHYPVVRLFGVAYTERPGERTRVDFALESGPVVVTIFLQARPVVGTLPLILGIGPRPTQPDQPAVIVSASAINNTTWSGEYLGTYKTTGGTLTLSRADYRFGGTLEGTLDAQLAGGSGRVEKQVRLQARFRAHIP